MTDPWGEIKRLNLPRDNSVIFLESCNRWNDGELDVGINKLTRCWSFPPRCLLRFIGILLLAGAYDSFLTYDPLFLFSLFYHIFWFIVVVKEKPRFIVGPEMYSCTSYRGKVSFQNSYFFFNLMVLAEVRVLSFSLFLLFYFCFVVFVAGSHIEHKPS